ncbi:hypothetical protein QYE76_064016 [Lolium multiflorum]|uniref:Mutator-like transposase n=1 Tax=Lolium multiflorum TaxID=4521 RepID=A0AAD8S7E1_LOLMU|nr:hypothetical protein QYE76_064016 [Lolium multiflorum]
MLNCNPAPTPDTKAKLSDGSLASDAPFYRSIVGALQYRLTPRSSSTLCSRCAYTCTLLEMLIGPRWRILRYVCGTMGYGLSLHASPSTSTDLVAYSDADWAGCPDTRRSTSGYCVYLGSSLVSWSSKRQPSVSLRGRTAVAECTWLRQLLSELSCPVDKATVVFCDNVSAVYLSANPVHHRRTKHIELDIHFVRGAVGSGARSDEEEDEATWEARYIGMAHEEEEERSMRQTNWASIGSEIARHGSIVVDYSNDETYLSDEGTDDGDPFAKICRLHIAPKSRILEMGEFVLVRFHWGGSFLNDGKELTYVGGSVGFSSIEVDKIELPEIRGHLRDHFPDYTEDMLMHWCPPGKELWDGLAVLNHDSACQSMANAMQAIEGAIADIYVESFAAEYHRDGEQEIMYNDSDVQVVGSLQPTQNSVAIDAAHQQGIFLQVGEFVATQDVTVQSSCMTKNTLVNRESAEVLQPQDDESEEDDEDYLPIDVDASDEDEEAMLLRKKFKQFKKKFNAMEMPSLDDMTFDVGQTSRRPSVDEEALSDDGNDTPYYDTSDNEDSYDEEDNNAELVRRTELYARFDPRAEVPVFSLGMRFSSKGEFIDATRELGVVERRCLRFKKNEKKRCRAICTWKNCPWYCLLSKTTRHTSWQISTFNNNHTCPPRKDKKLVTALRIANKYEKMIKANPTWDMKSLRETVQEDMLVNVSISKCKRAKSIVMKRMYDATKGEYSKVFDYQQELLRSNPGSTIVVKLAPNCVEPIFNRFYVCFDALKKGFMAGCRKVIGLDGCFFKGVNNGELLCALGRDANNQMYPLAWAVVDKETNDTWDWFCDLLFRDILLGDGDGWVIISDQQKGILNAVEKWAPRFEEYVADCYKITEFNKIYDHVLEPVEGMSAWPVSTRPKPKAPGYIKMPGRPKKERTREVGEKPKSKKVSKVGTIIKCSKCKGIGHNKRKCDQINGTGQYAPGAQGGGGTGSQGVTGDSSGSHIGGGTGSQGVTGDSSGGHIGGVTATKGSSATVVRKRKCDGGSGNNNIISSQSGPSNLPLLAVPFFILLIGPSAQSSPFREPTPEWNPEEAHAGNIRRAIEAGDEPSHNFSIWSEDDQSLTDGESVLRCLVNGVAEGESDDGDFPWEGVTSSEEVEEEEEEEDDSSSESRRPAPRPCGEPRRFRKE